MYIVMSVVTLALIVFALVDLITTDDSAVKHLPKLFWILLIVFLPLIGSLAWLVAGKDRFVPRIATGEPTTQRSTEQELADLDREIAFHEKQEKLRRLEEELRRRKGTSQA